MKKMPVEGILTLIIASVSLLRGIIVKDGNMFSPQAIAIELVSQACWVCLFLIDGWDKTQLQDVDEVDTLLLYHYRMLSVIMAVLFISANVLNFFRDRLDNVLTIQIFLLLVISGLFCLQDRYAQGTQLKFKGGWEKLLLFAGISLLLYLGIAGII